MTITFLFRAYFGAFGLLFMVRRSVSVRMTLFSKTREDDEEFKNAVDELFEELEAENPEHFAVRQYRKYKLAASFLISCHLFKVPYTISVLTKQNTDMF